MSILQGEKSKLSEKCNVYNDQCREEQALGEPWGPKRGEDLLDNPEGRSEIDRRVCLEGS